MINNKQSGEQFSKEQSDDGPRKALIKARPVYGEEGTVGLSHVVEYLVRTTNSFKAVHNTAFDFAGDNVSRECEHRFDSKEKIINCVNGTLFEVAITVGDVIAGEKHCWTLKKEISQGECEISRRMAKRSGGRFYPVDKGPGGFEEGINEIAFGGAFGFVFLWVRKDCMDVCFVGAAVVVASTGVKGTFVILSVNEVEWKVGSDR